MLRLKKTLFLSLISTILCCFVSSCFAADSIKINSVNFDSSDNLIHLAITGSFNGAQSEVIKTVLEDRVYFDITNAVLTFPSKMWQVKNSKISEVKISQFLLSPDTVRIVVSPVVDIKAYKKGNQVILKYSDNILGGEYFKTSHKKETKKEISQTPICAEKPLNVEVEPKINETDLQSLYYLNSVSVVPSGVIVNGAGFTSMSEPFILSSPPRAVFDINNATVNKSIRGKNFVINQNETARIGQFDATTARVVVATPNPQKYKAVISPDLENFILTTDEKISKTPLTDIMATLENIKRTKISNTQYIYELNFSNPVTTSYVKTSDKLTLEFYNLTSYNIEQAKSLPGVQFLKSGTNRLKVVIPIEGKIITNYEISADSKNIRLSVVTKQIFRPAVISTYYKVVLDAGHGGVDTGARREGILEKDINLRVMKLVAQKLTKNGVHIELTRDEDKTLSLADRVEFANSKDPDLFLSIHVNASEKTDIEGIETHWWHEGSYKLAQKVHKFLKDEIKSYDRGLFKSQFYVINHTQAPAILVEIGFISNEAERKLLLDEKRQDKIAEGITKGVLSYLKTRGKE